MKSPFCFIGLHNWKYKKEVHKVVGHPNNRGIIRVLVRECNCCGHREHHLLPRTDKKLDKWVSFDHINENETVEFKEL